MERGWGERENEEMGRGGGREGRRRRRRGRRGGRGGEGEEGGGRVEERGRMERREGGGTIGKEEKKAMTYVHVNKQCVHVHFDEMYIQA